MILGALFRLLGGVIGLVAGLILLPLFLPVVLILVGAWIAYRILVPTRPR
ncbi:hypothetical protein H5T55_02090 [Candidatus Bipolaricaulota bacterium]|nr:hypothetical protein [Candidatus Bipolaricaulota bacterium]